MKSLILSLIAASAVVAMVYAHMPEAQVMAHAQSSVLTEQQQDDKDECQTDTEYAEEMGVDAPECAGAL